MHPLLDCLRETKSSVLVCVLVWAFCIVSVPLAILLKEIVHFRMYGLLPGPVFIFCLAQTYTGLPAATSVPTEEKQRSLRTLILLFLNYFLIIFPAIICDISCFSITFYHIILILYLFSPLVDLILFYFHAQLACCLCCCNAESTVSDVAADQQIG